jgi:hypothetical protein
MFLVGSGVRKVFCFVRTRKRILRCCYSFVRLWLLFESSSLRDYDYNKVANEMKKNFVLFLFWISFLFLFLAFPFIRYCCDVDFDIFVLRIDNFQPVIKLLLRITLKWEGENIFCCCSRILVATINYINAYIFPYWKWFCEKHTDWKIKNKLSFIWYSHKCVNVSIVNDKNSLRHQRYFEARILVHVWILMFFLLFHFDTLYWCVCFDALYWCDVMWLLFYDWFIMRDSVTLRRAQNQKCVLVLNCREWRTTEDRVATICCLCLLKVCK